MKGSVSTTKNSPKEKREYRIKENLYFHISGSKLLTFHNFIFHALQNAKMGEVNFLNNFTYNMGRKSFTDKQRFVSYRVGFPVTLLVFARLRRSTTTISFYVYDVIVQAGQALPLHP